jgi:excisionase family DNA binding protein
MATATQLNVRETARRLGVHENTVRNWEKRGLLRAIRLPGSGYRRFRVEDVERLRQEMLTQLAPADTGPIIEPRRHVRGRIVHDDDVQAEPDAATVADAPAGNPSSVEAQGT